MAVGAERVGRRVGQGEAPVKTLRRGSVRRGVAVERREPARERCRVHGIAAAFGASDPVLPRAHIHLPFFDAASALPRTAPRCKSRSEEHTSELQSLMRISYAVFCLKKKKTKTHYS